MSRVANKPIVLPAGVEVKISGLELKVKGPHGSDQLQLSDMVGIKQDGNMLLISPKKDIANADCVAGTNRALINNMINGVVKGFEKKLILIGVGFKAQVQGKFLNLAIGFSHPIKYEIPVGIKIETPSQTEIIVKGINRHLVGQVAANIRAYRPPEPYKGKGIRYDGEVVIQKEGKKK